MSGLAEQLQAYRERARDEWRAEAFHRAVQGGTMPGGRGRKGRARGALGRVELGCRAAASAAAAWHCARVVRRADGGGADEMGAVSRAVALLGILALAAAALLESRRWEWRCQRAWWPSRRRRQ